MSAQRRNRQTARRQTERDTSYRRAYDLLIAAPPELQAAVTAAAGEIAPLGTALQVPPDQMLVAAAVLVASLLLCNIDPRDEEEINRRIAFARDALHVAVATRRIQLGAVGERPDGSFGIRADA